MSLSEGSCQPCRPNLRKGDPDVPIWTNSRPIPFTLPASGIFISGRDWYSARCGNVGFMFGPNYLWTHSLDRKLCRGCYNFVLVSHPPTVQPACCLSAILVLRLVLIRIRIVTHPDQICFLSTRSLCVTWRTRPVRRLKILWIVRIFADSIVFWLILMIDDLLHD